MTTGTLELFDEDVPPISGGDYVITVTHTATAISDRPIPAATQRITFSAPQVALDAAEVVQCSPPPGATGPFAELLPSVLLAEAALPWEREMPARGCPWLALLVFAEGELTGGDPATHLTTATIGDVQRIADAVLPQIALEADVASDQVVTYLRVATDVFTAVTPRADELPWLTHVRRSTAADGTTGDVAVVLANRFPPVPPDAASPPARAIAHLVSVEGLTPWLVDAPTFAHDEVVVLSLASWTFATVPDPAESFAGLALALENAEYDPATRTHDPGRLALRLAPPPGLPAEAAARLTNGYVPLTYHARSGEEAMAWYRGPVTPGLVAELNPPVAFGTADAALTYDPAHGVFDVSLASAWQIGRAAALGDRAFGQALYSYRQSLQQVGDAVVDRVARPHFADAPSSELGGLAHRALGALRGVLHHGVDAAAAAEAPAERDATPAPTGAALLAALAAPAVQDAVAPLVADALAPVAEWLAALTLLEPLPFTCLVPDARMLPRTTPPAGDHPDDPPLPGAIRFGYLDPNWTDALLDGALSLAVESSRQASASGAQDPAIRAAIGAALARRCGLDDPPPGPFTALLLRSDLVSGWPTLAVTPLDASGAPTIPVLRMDRLAPGVLLALFAGVPASVRIAEPHIGLTLGTDEQGAVELRNLVAGGRLPVGAPLDATVPILTTPTCLRGDGTRRVLAVTAAGGLLATLQDGLTAHGQRPVAFGPAALALQLVRAPQALLFDSTAQRS
jgi:hypothetical protein